LLINAITRVLGRQIMLVDSAQNCARAVEEMLNQHHCELRRKTAVSCM